MDHNISIEERAVGEITIYRAVCSCKTYRSEWVVGSTAASVAAVTHLNEVERARGYDLAP